MVFQLPDSKFCPETWLTAGAQVWRINVALSAIQSQLSKVLGVVFYGTDC